jgi:HK97 family phage major capsid protein
MPNLDELYIERTRVVTAQRDMMAVAEKEKRDFTSEEEESYGKLDTAFDEVSDSIKEAEEAEKRAKQRALDLVERENALKNARREPPTNEPGNRDDNQNQGTDMEARCKDVDPKYHDFIHDSVRSSPEYQEAFGHYLVRGPRIQEEYRAILESAPAYRALQADKDVSGGYMVAPEQFVARLIQAKDNILWFRQFATKLPTATGASTGYPSLDNDPADAEWTTELRTGTEDNTMDFEKRSMTPHPLAKRIKVSNRLIRISAIPIDNLVRDRLAYKFAVTEEKAYMTGETGSRPLGVFIASNAGIGTGRDVSTGNTTTTIKADNLINCKYTLKAQYRRNCRWIFHRDGVKMISKLKDGEGNYLWLASVRVGQPDTLLGYPVMESEYAPNTFSSAKYVGILGDLSAYWIQEGLNMQVQVVDQLYAENNQTGYIGRAEIDGMPVDANAFVRVKLA